MSNGQIPILGAQRAALLGQQQQVLDGFYRTALLAALPGVITGRICTSPAGSPVDFETCAAEAQAAALAALPRLCASVQLHQGPPQEKPES